MRSSKYLDPNLLNQTRLEAARYVKEDGLAKIPYLGRDSTVRFIEFLYRMGAQSVEISKLDRTAYDSNFIMELYVRVSDQDKTRDILNLIFKALPFAVEETATRVFRLEWTSKHSHPIVVKHGFPKF